MKRSPLKVRRRTTGFDRRVRALIHDRDEWRCVCCSRTPFLAPLVAHHRVNRGLGGSQLRNGPENGLTVCADCNGLMESDPDFAAKARDCGWKVRPFDDPATTPVLYPCGEWFRLTPDGTRVPAEAPERTT